MRGSGKLDSRLLLVDDDKINLNILVEILEEQYVLKTARSGEEALSVLPEFEPDLILLDVMMPGLDGYEVCRRIRRDKRFRYVKIILVSGRARDEERLKGYEVGADDYIAKPFMDLELDAKVRVFTRLKREEEVDRIQSELLSLFSHETRTPLNGIVGWINLLADSDSLDNSAREAVDMIQQSAEWLADSVDKATLLCDLKRTASLDPALEPPDDHVERVMHKFRAPAAGKGVKLKLNRPESEAPPLNADWSLLDRAIEFVLDNAVRFSPSGSEVVLETALSDCRWTLTITDLGPGLPSERREEVLMGLPPGLLDNHQRGMGISLAIVRRIMLLHHGELSITQGPSGTGTSVTLNLPREAPAEMQERAVDNASASIVVSG